MLQGRSSLPEFQSGGVQCAYVLISRVLFVLFCILTLSMHESSDKYCVIN